MARWMPAWKHPGFRPHPSYHIRILGPTIVRGLASGMLGG